MNMSPGASAEGGYRRRISSTVPRSEPRCMGMCSAWAMTRPRASKIAVEQSRRSLMLVEYEARMSAAPISSATVRRAAPMTSSVIRSMVRVRSFRSGVHAGASKSESWARIAHYDYRSSSAPAMRSRLGHQQESEVVDLRSLSRMDERRAVELLDDGGAFDHVSGAETAAIVDGAVDEVVFEEDAAPCADGGGDIGSGARHSRERRWIGPTSRHQPRVDHLDGLVRRGVTVGRLVHGEEALAKRVHVARRPHLRRDGHEQLVVLAHVAHVQPALQRAARRRHALALEPRDRLCFHLGEELVQALERVHLEPRHQSPDRVL